MAYEISLAGKTAIVTGSNSGIGLGIAWELAGSGADVVLNSFTDSEDDHALAKEIAEKTGTNARYIKADMSKGHECRALIEKAGACDILVPELRRRSVRRRRRTRDAPRRSWATTCRPGLGACR